MTLRRPLDDARMTLDAGLWPGMLAAQRVSGYNRDQFCNQQEYAGDPDSPSDNLSCCSARHLAMVKPVCVR